MPLFAELQKLMSWSGGPVNWDLARQGAISQLAAGHQPTSAAERSAVAEALRLADLWLDPVTDLPSGIDRTLAWSRVEWIEQTLPVWSGADRPAGREGGRRHGRRAAARRRRCARPDRRDHGPDGRR